MTNYEIMFILNPNLAEDEIDKINSQLEGIITSGGGKVSKIEKMGKRRLAYSVDKHTDGFYILFVATATGTIVREIERRLRVMDPVIKYLTVRMDEDMKRLDKIKAHRQKRAAHRAGAGGGRRAAAGERAGEGPGGVALEEGEEE
jgi:small subunit ribosomal protein S6